MLCLCKEPADNVQQESIEEEPIAAIVSRSIYTYIYIYIGFLKDFWLLKLVKVLGTFYWYFNLFCLLRRIHMLWQPKQLKKIQRRFLGIYTWVLEKPWFLETWKFLELFFGYFTLFCSAFQDPYAGLYVLMQEEDEHTSAIVSWFTCIYLHSSWNSTSCGLETFGYWNLKALERLYCSAQEEPEEWSLHFEVAKYSPLLHVFQVQTSSRRQPIANFAGIAWSVELVWRLFEGSTLAKCECIEKLQTVLETFISSCWLILWKNKALRPHMVFEWHCVSLDKSSTASVCWSSLWRIVEHCVCWKK